MGRYECVVEQEAGLLGAHVGVASRVFVRVVAVAGRKVLERDGGHAGVPDDDRRSGGRVAGGCQPPTGLHFLPAAISGDGLVDGGTDRAGLDEGRQLGDLMIAVGDVQQHRLGRGARVRVGGQVLHVAAALTAIPQHLRGSEDQHPVEVVRVGGLEDRLVVVEVDGAGQQQAVVDAGHAEHGAFDVG